jgi:hypothetical protein
LASRRGALADRIRRLSAHAGPLCGASVCFPYETGRSLQTHSRIPPPDSSLVTPVKVAGSVYAKPAQADKPGDTREGQCLGSISAALIDPAVTLHCPRCCSFNRIRRLRHRRLHCNTGQDENDDTSTVWPGEHSHQICQARDLGCSWATMEVPFTVAAGLLYRKHGPDHRRDSPAIHRVAFPYVFHRALPLRILSI